MASNSVVAGSQEGMDETAGRNRLHERPQRTERHERRLLWAFAKNVSVIFAYDINKEQALASNKTFTTQLDINFT